MADKGTGGRARIRSRIHDGVRWTAHVAGKTASIEWRDSSLVISKAVSFSKKKSFDLALSGTIAIATTIIANDRFSTIEGLIAEKAALESEFADLDDREERLADQRAALESEFADLGDREEHLADQQEALEKRRADLDDRENRLVGAWKQWLEQPFAEKQLKKLAKQRLQWLKQQP